MSRRVSFFVLLFCGFLLAHPVMAVEQLVVMESDGVKVTVEDLQAAIASMPESRAKAAYSQQHNLQAIAENLLIWRTLAQRGEKEGLLNDPQMKRRLQLQREKFLGEVLLKIAEGEVQESEVAEMAELDYKANIDRYSVPTRLRASHILIKVGERSKDEARTLAGEILEKLRAGQDFARLAREYSEDNSASRGGSLGQIKVHRLVPEFKDALLELEQPGELSGLVKTQFGFHIIRLDEKRQEHTVSFEEVKDRIVREKLLQVRNNRRQALVDPIRDPDRLIINGEILERLVKPLEQVE